MDVCLWSHLKEGNIRRFRKVPVAIADTMFREHKKLLGNPFVTYYRVTLEDRRGVVVRDTNWEVHGIGGG